MKLCTFVLLLLFNSLAYSGDWSGNVTTIKASNISNVILFSLSGELKSAERCNETKMYAIDLSAPGGKTLLDLLTTAFIHNIPVEANSLATCKTYWKAEGVKEIYLRR